MQGTQTDQQPEGVAAVRPRLRPESIEEIVQTDVVTAEPDTPVATVVAKMAEEEVGSVVVVDEDSPVGIITDRNVALALEETPDVSERRAEELMEGDLVTTTLEASIFDVIHTLGDAGVRRLPIVDDEGRLAGIVSLDDVLLVLTAELESAGEVLRAQIPRL